MLRRWWPWILAGVVVVAVWGQGSVNNIVIQKIAEAIAYAEGFYRAGSRPQRNHNPGDLETDVTGQGIGTDGPYIVYASEADGWAALDHLVRLMFAGSHIYNPSMTIAEVAAHYTTTEVESWAENVSARLGVTIDTPLSAIN